MTDMKSSQFPALANPTGNEEVLVFINGQNYRISVRNLGLALSGVVITAADIGLGNVNNTADLDKPISTLAQQALDNLQNTLLAVESLANLNEQAITEKANSVHSHTVADITDLVSTLSGYLNQTDLTNLQQAIAAKADSVHSHTTADVTGLDTALSDIGTALSNKSDVGHAHAMTDVTGLDTALAGKADTTHNHAIADVTGLQTALDSKINSADTALLIRQMTRPIITTTPMNIASNAADISLDYTTANGYSMGTVVNKARYKAVADSVWIDLPDQLFTSGQFHYMFNLIGLTPSTDYNYEVYLSDVNNPTLDIVSSGVLTTTA